jgi:segregation and condensation protein B
MSIKAKIEAIIYAAEEPVTLDQIAAVLKEAGLADQLLNQSETGDASETRRDPKSEKAEIKAALRGLIDDISATYADENRGMEIRHVAGGYRMSTKAEHHDVVRSFAKSLKSPVRLSLQALETLAVIAYKQPVTAPEISEIRGVDSSGVLATLIDRKLITTAGRKAVVGRPILYKTTKDFLLRFGLKDVNELPSMEEFEKMTQEHGQENLFDNSPVADATGVPHESIDTASAENAASEDASHESETAETS